MIGCGKYGATFLVSWDRYVTLSDQVTVRWRFDDRPIESARFRVASLGRTTGAPLFFNFEQFGRGLMASKRLVVEAGSSETAFDLTGADKAVPALLGPCISKLAAPSG